MADNVPQLSPRNLTEAIEFCDRLAKTSFVPDVYKNKPGDILACLQYGAELGLGPMQALQSIAVINGRPSVYGDAMLALVQASGLLEYIEETDDGKKATCSVKRKGDSKELIYTFSDDDAQKAGLLNKQGPWTQYRREMRKFRARGFALRGKFADVLKGLISREEAQDYPMKQAERVDDTVKALPHDDPPPKLESASRPMQAVPPTDATTTALALALGAPPKVGSIPPPPKAPTISKPTLTLKPDPIQPPAQAWTMETDAATKLNSGFKHPVDSSATGPAAAAQNPTPPAFAAATPPPEPPKPAGVARMTDGQIKLVWARARQTGLVQGEDCGSLIMVLNSFGISLGISESHVAGKTSAEVAAAMIALIPPARLTQIVGAFGKAMPKPAPAPEPTNDDAVEV